MQKRILLIEHGAWDWQSVIRLLREGVAGAGLELQIEEAAVDAGLEERDIADFDLVIIDIDDIPAGFDYALPLLLEGHHRPGTPVIVLTDFTMILQLRDSIARGLSTHHYVFRGDVQKSPELAGRLASLVKQALL